LHGAHAAGQPKDRCFKSFYIHDQWDLGTHVYTCRHTAIQDGLPLRPAAGQPKAS
jgi:hypothetical protein